MFLRYLCFVYVHLGCQDLQNAVEQILHNCDRTFLQGGNYLLNCNKGYDNSRSENVTSIRFSMWFMDI